MALHTGHTPLCHHLHHIGKEPSPFCIHCPGMEESVPHFLLDCHHYHHQRHMMTNTLGHRASSLSFLLLDPEANTHLTRYVNATGCFHQMFGEVPLPHKPPD
ncbi:hypothetical protein BDR04DRAFT_1025369 [Suillus decipiens]|nr:hypothetical protein BDR04DRAFT_1025369 [Suillus decipiens]